MTSLQILGLFALAGLLVQAGILGLAAHVCRLPRRGIGRAFVIVLTRIIFSCGAMAIIVSAADDPTTVGLLTLVVAGAEVVLTVWLIRRLFGGRLGPSIGTWAIQLVAGIFAALALVFGLREFVQTYRMTAGSMNPNLRGTHTVQDQPDGTHLVVTVLDPDGRPGFGPRDRSVGVVAETYEFRELLTPQGPRRPADRILCNRVQTPDRWSAVVFRYPPDPSITYVKRLVGLPEEVVEIRDGAVWINAERQTPPERLGPIRYSGIGPPGAEPRLPFEQQLGPDEFFVLGDNTESSSDSRFWGPVSRANVVGVVDAIYWPPGRWRRDP